MRHPVFRILSVLLFLLVAACAGRPTRDAADPAPALLPVGQFQVPGEAHGRLSGAAYRFEVPANWNGELVMYLHGYEPPGVPRSEPLLQDDFDRWLLAQGFAVARSAFRSQGWAVAEALEDNERLRQHVVQQLPDVRRTWALGHSMGGHLVLATLERYGRAYDGGLSLCGANSPAEEMMRDGVLAVLAAAEALLPGVFGQFEGGLADPAAPPAVDGLEIERRLIRAPEIAERLGAAFEIRRDDLAFQLMFRYLILRELIDRAGGFPLDNRDYRYASVGLAELDARVRRYAPEPAAAAYVRNNFDLQGRPQAPAMLLSNVYDPTVPARFSARYVELAEAARSSRRVRTRPPQGDDHCGFDLEAVGSALSALRDWVEER